jgi:anti-sigma factor RsiW
MSCHRARELIDPFIDGELDRRQTGAFRRHLDECEACKLAYRNQLTLRSGLKGKSLYYRPTDDLRKRIRASLRQSLQHSVEPVEGVLL